MVDFSPINSILVSSSVKRSGNKTCSTHLSNCYEDQTQNRRQELLALHQIHHFFP